MLSLNRENYQKLTGESLEKVDHLPVKVLQFGEGNFLRGFVDWMLDKMIQQGLFDGRVIAIQPIKSGLVPALNEQNGLYTLLLRGIENGQIQEERSIIRSIKGGINPYSDFDAYLDQAKNPHLRYIISNTTEAGIAYLGTDRPTDTPPASFPGKLTLLLYQRYIEFNGAKDKGFVILPCELIERNGDCLKKIVLQLAEEWGYESAFIDWINQSNYFLNTLVDRIVTGFPRNELDSLTKEMGYSDSLLNTAEIFHLWVIEGDQKLSEELPFTKVGLNVVWTDDMTPYRTRKVRILNGGHTMTVLAAYLSGLNTVKECTEDNVVVRFMKKGIFEEIIPTLNLSEEELASFANSVLDRFANPFIEHFLLSIALNSVSKFKVRVLPSLLQYIENKKMLPEVLCFSLAALILFYKGHALEGNKLLAERNSKTYAIQDDMDYLVFFKKVWEKCDGSVEGFKAIAKQVLSQEELWGQDLSLVLGLVDVISKYLSDFYHKGIKQVMTDLVEGRCSNANHTQNQWAG